jgi:hypothetical protein
LLAETHHTALIHNKHGAETGTAFLVPQTVGLRDLAFRVPVRELWVGKTAHRCGPGPMSRDMITTDAQYLGLPLLELAV